MDKGVNMYQNEIKSMVFRRYRIETNLMNAEKQPNPPKFLVNFIKETIEKHKKRMLEMGITEERYQELAKEYQLEMEIEDINFQRMGDCYHHLKALQNMLKKNTFEVTHCIYRNEKNDCSMCKQFKRVTQDQESNFLYGFDIDTGEDLNINLDI